MSKYIVLYNFNKYYNRKIKRLATFAEYEALITPGDNTPAQFSGFKREFRNFNTLRFNRVLLRISGKIPSPAE